MVPIEVWCRSGDGARANWVLHRMLPSLGGIIFHELIFKEIPGGWFIVEFGQGDQIGVALQGFRKLG